MHSVSPICSQAYKCALRICSHLEREDAKVQKITLGIFSVMAMSSLMLGSPLFFSATFGGILGCVISLQIVVPYVISVIDYSHLESYCITPKRIKKLEQDIAKGEYNEFLKIVKLTIEDRIFALDLSRGRATPWFLKQVEKLILKNALSEEMCEKLHGQIYGSDFEMVWLDKTVTLICKSGWPVPVKKYSLMLASPVYRQKIKSGFNDTCEDLIPTQTSYNAVNCFKEYLNKGAINEPSLSKMGICETAELLNLAEFYQIKKFKSIALDKIQSNIKNKVALVCDEEGLESLLQEITANRDLIGAEWCAKAEYDAISNLYKLKYNSEVPYYLGKDNANVSGCIPIKALHLIGSEGVIKEYLEDCKTIFFHNPLFASDLSVLEIYPWNLDKFDSIVLSHMINFEDLEERVIKRFSRLNTIYLQFPQDTYDLQVLEHLNVKFNKQIEIIANSSLLSNKTKVITFKTDAEQQTLTIFKSLKFSNLSINNKLKIDHVCANDFVKQLNTTHEELGFRFVPDPNEHGIHLVEEIE